MHTQSEVLVPCRFVPPVLSRRPQNIFIFTIIINITIINKSLSSTLKCVILLLPHTLAGIFSRFGIFVGISCPVRFPCYLQHFGAGSCHFTCILRNILEFEPLIFPSICNILVLELFMSHAFCNQDSFRVGLGLVYLGLVFGLVQFLLGWFGLFWVGFRVGLGLALGWFRVCLGLVESV